MICNSNTNSKRSAFIETTPQHDEILANVFMIEGQERDKLINNKKWDNGSYFGSKTTIHDYSFKSAAKTIIKRDFHKIWFTTLETPEAAALFIIALILRKEIHFIAHHADVFGPVHQPSRRSLSLKRRLFSLLFARIARRFANIYVLSSEVASNCKYPVGVMDLSGLGKILPHTKYKYKVVESDKIKLGILGSVDPNRRNYNLIAHIDEKWAREVNLEVRLIGDMAVWDGINFIEKIKKSGLENIFWWPEQKLSNRDLLREVQNVDAIIAPYANEDYGSTVTSANKVFARGMSKPILEGCRSFRLISGNDYTILAKDISFKVGLQTLVEFLRV